MTPAARSCSRDVVVVGCGLMGSALARALAKGGFSVAAWNRTPEKAEALAGDGIEPMRSVVDAVRSSPLVLACTLNRETTLSALDPVEAWDGTALVNVTSGTPDDAEAMERWATERGADYLEGGIIAYPREIGSPEGTVLYSGSTAVWSKHERTLMTLGGASRHVSEDTKAVNVLYTGIGAFIITALGSYVEAATYVLGQNVSASVLRAVSLSPVQTLSAMTEEAVEAIATDQHGTDQATLEIFGDGARAALGAMQRAGHPAGLFAAAVANLDAAEAAGLGKLGVYAQAKVIGSAAQPAYQHEP